MTDIPTKPMPGTGLLKGTAYVVALLLTLPAWINTFAWLNAGRTFQVFLSDTGTAAFINGSGYLLGCLLVGWLCKRFGTGTVLVTGAMLSGLTTLGYALAPTWNVVEILGFLGGLGSALIFTGIIIHFTMRFGMRPLLWWFVCYSARSLFIPLLNTTALTSTFTWQSGNLVIAVVYGIAVILFAATRRLWNTNWFSDADVVERVQVGDILGMQFIWIAFALLLLAGSLESVSYSFWSILVGNLGRNMGINALTFWRYAGVIAQITCFGILIVFERRINWRLTFWICAVGVMIGASVATWGGSDWMQFSGNTLMMFFVVPLFPGLLLFVKNQIPPAFVPMVIGWLAAASSIGSDLISRVRGNSFSTSVNLTIVFVLGVLFVAIVELATWLQATKKKKAPPAFLPEEL